MAPMKNASIQVSGKTVGAVGYGMLGLGKPWENISSDRAVELLKLAVNQGSTLWNGSTHYGTPDANSAHICRKYFEKYPEDVDKIVVTMKGAFSHASGPDGSREGIRASVEEAVKAMGDVKKIDTFSCARVDPKAPIETSIEALAELVKEGKIGGVALSEVSAESIRRAHKVHPVALVEIEMSLFTPDPLKNGVMDTCRELGIPVIAYSPVGRGWLTSDWRSMMNLPADDFRRLMGLERFTPEAVEQNARLAEAVETLAKRKGVTSAQVAIGWVVRKGAIPIPGSVKEARILENSTPAELTDAEMEELKQLMDKLPVSGGRFGGEQDKLLNQ